MTLLIILGLVFLAVTFMVVLGEKFGKPMESEDQAKFSKYIRVLVFVVLIVAIIKAMM